MHVLLVENGTMLDEGLASVLQEAELAVSSLIYTDEIAFVRSVSFARPDIILLNETSPLDPARVFELLKTLPEVIAPRVILVHTKDNTLDVYDTHRIAVTRRSDLVSLIRHDSSRI